MKTLGGWGLEPVQVGGSRYDITTYGGDKVAKLTAKQRRFCDEYLIDLNATQAAIRAGYSVQTANEQGSRLLAKVNIQTRIKKLMNIRSERTRVTQDLVINELARIGFADIKDFIKFKTAKTVLAYDNETGEPIIDYRQIIEIIHCDEVDGRLIQEVSLNSKGVFTFKLHDKMKALELLGKHLGMFKDKLEINNPSNDPFEDLTTEELKALINL